MSDLKFSHFTRGAIKMICIHDKSGKALLNVPRSNLVSNAIFYFGCTFYEKFKFKKKIYLLSYNL